MARITIQDIADELGLSRNTVSKAINNTGIIADATRETILKKAAEMGYKQFSYFTPADVPSMAKAPESGKTEIAFFTTGRLDSSHFAATMLDKIQKQLGEAGYGMTIYRILKDDIEAMQLPVHFDINRVSGMICAELFDIGYCRMISDLSIPVLFIDTPVVYDKPLAADVLLMDNTASIYTFLGKIKARGKKRIGFVGEPGHCRSFYERYTALKNAADYFGLDYDPSYSVIYESLVPATYTDDMDFLIYLKSRLSDMKILPEVLLCANDFVAIDTMRMCGELKIKIPDDIMICGFDDSSESRIVSPQLTTIHIHSQGMGSAAVGILLSRIREPGADFTTMYVSTDLIMRASTGD